VRFSRRRRLEGNQAWLGLITATVVVLGVIGSTVASGSVARYSAAQSRQSFTSSSTAIAATLQLAMLHEQDLMSRASGFIALDVGAARRSLVSRSPQARRGHLAHCPDGLVLLSGKVPR
jgi:hypothetical protein